MPYVKNKRYGPLYKKFIRLRKNVQYRNKFLKFKISFKKQKWENFILHLKLKSYRKKGKGNYNLYDHNKKFIPKFGSSFKRKFKENLILKQKFKLFYGHLLEKKLKKKTKTALKKVKLNKNIIDSTFFLLESLETRLDVILYRAHFSSSLKGAHQLISHGHIQINGVTTNKKSFMLKKGDLVTVKLKAQNRIHNTLLSSNFWPMPPKHLQINYKTLEIIYIESLKFINFSTMFPFQIDLKSIIRLYNI